jgi:hypothetical protein
MVLKILFLNFPQEGAETTSHAVTVTYKKIKDKPTLHDFHGIIMDVNEILQPEYWGWYKSNEILNASDIYMGGFSGEVKEQISTGGITFLFCGKNYSADFAYRKIAILAHDFFNNYFCSPIDLGVVSEHGDTFYVKNEELKYFNSLIKQIPKDEITWDCYFSELPKNSRIIGTSRADYPVFAEVPIGNGKLVVLPRFKNRKRAVAILINEILPQMVHEEEPMIIPEWLSGFSSDFENSIRTRLDEIEKAKKLLYAKDKPLKKAVASAFKTIGFNVNELPDGTNADLEIFDEELRAVVEVKGHEHRQSDRNDALQLLGYSTPEGNAVKGVFVSNSEFCKPPNERRKEAFTQGAIDLAIDTKLSLVSTTDLYEIVSEILQGKMLPDATKKIREKIIKGKGIFSLP